MKIATILFTYNRSKHTQQVLDALRRNTILPDKLYIFQDGPKPMTDMAEWMAVSDVIKNVTWCNTEVVISDSNRGLANSIKSGVSRVFETYDAVIVLEDDCVSHPQFMEYMTKALNKYEQFKEIYHIGACAEPVDVIENGTDAYFLGRINSCGWGTWKNRWNQFNNDYTMIARVKGDKDLSAWFRLWGEDLEGYIRGNIDGTTDSWAAFWALTVIIKKGYCLAPYESLIKNIGYDNTGVHCGTVQPVLRLRPEEKMSRIILPDQVEFVADYQNSFANCYSWVSPVVKNEYYKNTALNLLEMIQKRVSIAGYLKDRKIRKVAIWGRGKLSDYVINELKGIIEIGAITERYLTGSEYWGIPMIKWRELPDDISMVIVIPGYDIRGIKNMISDTELVGKMIPILELTEAVLEFAIQNEKEQ